MKSILKPLHKLYLFCITLLLSLFFGCKKEDRVVVLYGVEPVIEDTIKKDTTPTDLDRPMPEYGVRPIPKYGIKPYPKKRLDTLKLIDKLDTTRKSEKQE